MHAEEAARSKGAGEKIIIDKTDKTDERDETDSGGVYHHLSDIRVPYINIVKNKEIDRVMHRQRRRALSVKPSYKYPMLSIIRKLTELCPFFSDNQQASL